MTANQIRALDDAALYELSLQKGRRGNASTDARTAQRIICERSGVELKKRTQTASEGGINMTDKERNMEKPTPEQAKRLLQAIFAEEDTDEDNYPETITDKVSYSEYVLTHNLQYIGKAIDRLSRLSRLFLVADKSGGLPDIITNNELRMALQPLMQVENDIKDITEMLIEIYRATKPSAPEEGD